MTLHGREKGTGTICAQHPPGRSGKWCLSPFPGWEACRTFGELLEDSDADYMALCDQDDVWLPGRIAKPLERVRAVEREQGAATPILAHTDLAVVDENLDTIAPSFWAYRHLDPYRGSELNRLLVQNVVTGCTTIINRALARLACPIPESIPMHDWWLALVASAFGRIETVPEATVLYRQHGNNSVGAICHDWRYVLRLTREVLFRRRNNVSSTGPTAGRRC